MKNPTLRLLGTLVALALIAPLASAKSSGTPRLQVRVETPTVFDIIHERDIADALVAELSDTFRRAGFDGRIAQLDRQDEAAPGIPVLGIRLLDWETRPTGMIECRFTATVTAVDGEEIRLGAYHGTAFSWHHPTRFSLARAFEDAAANAMKDLYRDFAKLDTAHADRALSE